MNKILNNVNKLAVVILSASLTIPSWGNSLDRMADRSITQKLTPQSVTEIKITGKEVPLSSEKITLNIGSPTIESISNEGATKGNNSRAIENSILEPVAKNMSPMIYNPSYSPICTTLDINTLYNINISTGVYYCIYFEITQKSRTEFIALLQNSNRQVDVDVLQDINADYNFTVLGSSSETDSDDSVITLTEPGHYYMQMYATHADGGSISFAAASNTTIDVYEGNDSISTSYTLTNDVNEIFANLDYSGDVDYYRYQSKHGQDLYFLFTDTVNNNQWIVELLNSSSWVELTPGVEYKFSSLSIDDYAYIRVRQRSSAPYSNSYYQLSFGSLIDDISNVEVDTTENLILMALGSTSPFYVTQAHNVLNWSAKIKDSAGYPIQGVQVVFHYQTEDIPAQTSVQYTNSSGIASASLTLPDCTGNRSVTHYHSFSPYAGNWKTEYDAGAWLIEVPKARGNSLFFGGYEEVGVSTVTMAHICKQTYLP